LLSMNDPLELIATEQFFLESFAMSIFEGLRQDATHPLLRRILELITRKQRDWFARFGRNQGRRFDAFGFGYTTREHYDGFYPGYGSTWPVLHGSIGILWEQPSARGLVVEREDGTLRIVRPSDEPRHRALHGLTRTLVANMVQGVTQGFEKKLEIQGVGYRASLKGTDLELSVGYSHTVTVKPRQGITFEVPTPTEIFVKGTDKQMVGQTAAEIRKVRPPEPYKGKGIRYEGEYVRRKVGKRA